jgi:hypothetical protein
VISAFRTPTFGQIIPSALQPNKSAVPSSLETRLRDLKTPTDRQSALKAMEDPEIFQAVTDGEVENPHPKIQATRDILKRDPLMMSEGFGNPRLQANCMDTLIRTLEKNSKENKDPAVREAARLNLAMYRASEKDIRRSFKFLSWGVKVLVFLDKMRRIYRTISKIMQHFKQYIQKLIGKVKQWIGDLKR